MPAFIDQTYERIELNEIPRRIISLVPSQSELIWDLGLSDHLVGITKFCIHPDAMFRKVERVGGTKKLDLEKIRALQPDLIIGNKEENDKEQIEALKMEFKVWMSDIYTLGDAFTMINEIGKMCGRQEESKALLLEIGAGMDKCRNIFNHKRTLYFIWNDPLMIAGGKTFIGSVMEHAGLFNLSDPNERYPMVTYEDIRRMKPELILLSSEPYPFKKEHADQMKEQIREGKICMADGEMFSWYGSRMRKIPDYLQELKVLSEKGTE